MKRNYIYPMTLKITNFLFYSGTLCVLNLFYISVLKDLYVVMIER